jgi:hypothetical protein
MAISSLIIVKPASSQTTPSVPEFTLKYIDYSYDVPPTYGINQYTGQNVTIQAGYHVDNRTMLFTIKNQPFTSYNDSSGNYITLYYNFRYKGHYGDEWSYYPFAGVQTTHSYGPYGGGPFLDYPASNSDYTVTSINLDVLTSFPGGPQIPDGSQVDFQVQAQIGHIDPIPSGLLAGDFYNFTGESSDWSNTQTITVSNGSTSTSISSSTSANPTPTSTPAVPEFLWLVILPLFILMLSIAVIFRLRKQAIKNLHSFF